jgi:hypothetical protein
MRFLLPLFLYLLSCTAFADTHKFLAQGVSRLLTTATSPRIKNLRIFPPI